MIKHIHTLADYLLQEEQIATDASGSFFLLLTRIEVAAKRIADQVRAVGLVDLLGKTGTINTFVLYGNVNDLVRCRNGESTTFVSLSDFLATQVFGAWDVTLTAVIGQQTVMADADQAGGQDVPTEASDELHRAQGRGLTLNRCRRKAAWCLSGCE